MIVRKARPLGEISPARFAAVSPARIAAVAPGMMLVLSLAAPGCTQREAAPVATESVAASARPTSGEEGPTGSPGPSSAAASSATAHGASDEGAPRKVKPPTLRDSGAGKKAQRIEFDEPLSVTGAPGTSAPR